jgi:hypothetical protein
MSFPPREAGRDSTLSSDQTSLAGGPSQAGVHPGLDVGPLEAQGPVTTLLPSCVHPHIECQNQEGHREYSGGNEGQYLNGDTSVGTGFLAHRVMDRESDFVDREGTHGRTGGW